MAKKRQENTDVESQIFDFIFEQGEKPVDKRKPIKPTGVNLTGDMTDALMMALESPGVYIGDTVINEVKDALDIDIATGFKIDDTPTGKIKITTGNLGDLLRDPEGFINKSSQKAKMLRNMGRLEWAGEEIKMLKIQEWARKSGFSTRQASALANIETNRWSKSGRNNLYMEASDAAQRTLSRQNIDLNQIRRDLESNRILVFDRSDNTKRAVLQENALDAYVTRNYANNAQAQKVISQYFKLQYGKKINDTENQRQIFADLLQEDMIGRRSEISSALANNPNDQGLIKEKDNLNKALNHINYLRYKDYQEKLSQRVEQLKTLRSTGNISNTQQQELRDLEKAQRNVKSWNNLSRLGKMEGWYNGVKSGWGAWSNVVPGILSGDFYDYKKNGDLFFGRSELGRNFAKLALPARYEGYEFKMGQVKVKSELVLSKADNIYNNSFEQIYYLTPKSLFRTLLVNGEGFKRMDIIVKRDFFKSVMKQDLAGFEQICSLLGVGGDLNVLKKSYYGDISLLENLFKDPAVSNQIMGILQNNPQLLAKFNNAMQSSARFNKLMQRHSIVGKYKTILADKLTGKFRRAIYERAKNFIGRIVVDDIKRLALENTLKTWLETGGIKVLVGAIVEAIGTALGIASGNPILGFITFIVGEVLYQTTKIILKVLVLVIFGILGVIALLFFSGDMGKVTSTVANLNPYEVVTCSGYTPVEGADYDLGGFPGSIGSLPEGTECFITGSNASQGNFGCYGGPGAYESHCSGWSSAGTPLPAIDLNYVSEVYTPSFCNTSQRNCVVVYASDMITCGPGTNAGGIVTYNATYGGQTFEIKAIHVTRHVSTGDVLGPGQHVATVQNVTDQGCSTGMHIHLETRVNGGFAHPLSVLQGFNCPAPNPGGCVKADNGFCN